MTQCCVLLCTSDRRKKLVLSFHEFPANDVHRQAWIKAVSRKEFVPNGKSCSSLVCSLYFMDSDYQPGSTMKRHSKQGAVPSVFPDYTSYMQQPLASKRRKLERNLSEHAFDANNTSKYRIAGNRAEDHVSRTFNEDAGCPSSTSAMSLQECPQNISFHFSATVTEGRFPLEATDGLPPLALNADSAAQTTDNLIPRKQLDVTEINRLRVQLFRKSNGMRRLQKENKLWKRSWVLFRSTRCILLWINVCRKLVLLSFLSRIV